MSRVRPCVAFLAGAALLVLTPGCQQAEPEKPQPELQPVAPAPHVASQLAQRKRAPRETEKIEAPPEAPAKALPQTAMSDELQATNRVKVGDKLPDGELPDLSGKAQSIPKLLGAKATVLFFWTADNPYSRTEMEDLQADVYEPFQVQGVQVVGINLDKDVAQARQAAGKAGAKFPLLSDPDKKYFGKLATDKEMRTYLAGPQGNVLWFDVEYSRATQRDLLQGVKYLIEPGAKK